MLQMWSPIKVNPSKAPFTLFSINRIFQRLLSVRAAQMVAKLKEGLGQGQKGPLPARFLMVMVGGMGKGLWEKEVLDTVTMGDGAQSPGSEGQAPWTVS